MTDTLYVALTVAFFAAMIAYVNACARLGRMASAGESVDEH
jgi:hypothetical protein